MQNQTRSFFRAFQRMLILIVVGTVFMVFQLVYSVAARGADGPNFALALFAVYFIVSFWRGLRERDFRDWNKVVINGNEITGYTLFGKKLATINLTPGVPVYWAKVWILKERGQGEPILVISNEPFELPVAPDQLFRTTFDNTRQLLIVGAPEHPSEWFPPSTLIEVEQKLGVNIML